MTADDVMWLCFVAAAVVVSYAFGLEAGTPVFDIKEIVYLADPYRMRALDGVVCYISPKVLP